MHAHQEGAGPQHGDTIDAILHTIDAILRTLACVQDAELHGCCRPCTLPAVHAAAASSQPAASETNLQKLAKRLTRGLLMQEWLPFA